MTEIVIKIRKWFEASSKKQKLVVALLAFGLLSTGVLLSLDGTASVAKDPLSSTPFYLLSAFVKMMAVLLLIVGSSVVFRRWLQPGQNGKTIRQMRLLETIRLSPKQALHLVLIGDQKLLIGATDQNVSLIAPIEDSLVPITAEESQPQPGMDFGAMIQSFNFSTENIPVKDKSQP